jgi:REP element-mobilizing transposase RayT
MARRPRLAVAGELHHVGLRGHNGGTVFADDADRAGFLAMLCDSAALHRVSVHAYALLQAEVQLLVTPFQSDALGRLMQSLGRRYVAAFNRRHGRRGTLWEGRFRSSLLQSGAALVDATVHIECLPVAQGLVVQAVDWPWSSATWGGGAIHWSRSTQPTGCLATRRSNVSQRTPTFLGAVYRRHAYRNCMRRCSAVTLSATRRSSPISAPS